MSLCGTGATLITHRVRHVRKQNLSITVFERVPGLTLCGSFSSPCCLPFYRNPSPFAVLPFSFFQLPFPNDKSRRLLLFLIKSILYGIWRFRNKAVFHNGREDSRANTKYIIIDIKNRIKADRFRFSPSKFRSLWCHLALCDFHQDDNLVFKF